MKNVAAHRHNLNFPIFIINTNKVVVELSLHTKCTSFFNSNRCVSYGASKQDWGNVSLIHSFHPVKWTAQTPSMCKITRRTFYWRVWNAAHNFASQTTQVFCPHPESDTTSDQGVWTSVSKAGPATFNLPKHRSGRWRREKGDTTEEEQDGEQIFFFFTQSSQLHFRKNPNPRWRLFCRLLETTNGNRI